MASLLCCLADYCTADARPCVLELLMEDNTSEAEKPAAPQYSNDFLVAKIMILEQKQAESQALIAEQRRECFAAVEELREELREMRAAQLSPVAPSGSSVLEASPQRLEIAGLQRTASGKTAASAGLSPDRSARPTTSSFRLHTEDFETQDGVAEYEFSQSIWDAAFLCFFREVCWCDKGILVIALAWNYFLQLLMLCVIAFNMLDNPFPNDRVEEMISWRIHHGHAENGFDKTVGASQLKRLCHNELWSFEQGEYEEMHNYLYKPIKGYFLSLLAIILWVLTTISEYRRTVEQALAIKSLPTVASDQSCIMAQDGAIRIVGIFRHTRIGALLLLSLPRFLVVASISVVGCQYLAQTPSLHDIVLNAVALAFVLDVDEQLFSVFCTQRIRNLVGGLQPLPCARNQRPVGLIFHTLHRKDVVRYLLVAGLILYAYFAYLLPFHHNIESAATALCGGGYDFTYRGGEAGGEATVVVYDAKDWSGYCPQSTMASYIDRYYGHYNTSTPDFSTRPHREDLYTVKQRVIMNYAFSQSCPEGQVLSPVSIQAPESPRHCKELPWRLKGVLPDGVRPGAVAQPQRCLQFRPELSQGTCTGEKNNGEACVWTWQSHHCENAPPGDFNRQACTSTTSPTANQVRESCRVWRWFQATSPFYNCKAVTACASWPDLDCFVFTGDFTMDYRATESLNITSLPQTGILGMVNSALALTAGLEQSNVFVHPGEPWQEELPKKSVTRIRVQFLFRRCPVHFWAEKFMAGKVGAKLIANMKGIVGASAQAEIETSITSIQVENVLFQTTAQATERNEKPWFFMHLP